MSIFQGVDISDRCNLGPLALCLISLLVVDFVFEDALSPVVLGRRPGDRDRRVRRTLSLRLPRSIRKVRCYHHCLRAVFTFARRVESAHHKSIGLPLREISDNVDLPGGISDPRVGEHPVSDRQVVVIQVVAGDCGLSGACWLIPGQGYRLPSSRFY